MNKLFLLLLSMTVGTCALHAQSADKAFDNNKGYTGAKATREKYHAIYQLDNSDPKVIEKTIRNMNNALSDPRLVGKVQLELIAFSGGTDAYLKGGKYEADLGALVQKGVIVAQCNNTLREKKISRDKLYDFIAVVPSGNGELIIRAAQGWTIIKP